MILLYGMFDRIDFFKNKNNFFTSNMRLIRAFLDAPLALGCEVVLFVDVYWFLNLLFILYL